MRVLRLGEAEAAAARAEHDAERATFVEREVGGLEPRVAPERDPALRQWLHAPSGQAVIHLNLWGTDNTIPRDVQPGKPTGAIHHVAFECDGFDETVEKLKARGLEYGYNEIPSIPLRQLFVADPNNVLLELNFRG